MQRVQPVRGYFFGIVASDGVRGEREALGRRSMVHAGPGHAKRGNLVAGLAMSAGVVAALIVGAVAAHFFLEAGSPTTRLASDTIQLPVKKAPSTMVLMSAAMHHDVAVLEYRAARRASIAARRRHLAALAAAQGAQSPSPGSSTAPPSSGGANAADSPLGICIRDAEEGGSFAWGPGNGGGAYQFQLSTWERYGGAASEYGVAGAAYQDQIFDNAISAGGASNWTDYDGC
jgi:hypothetical protein